MNVDPENPEVTYDAAAIRQHFDQFGIAEWERLVRTPVEEVKLHIHTQYLKQHIRPGQRVLEIGAGAGRFTQVLADLGARVLVADISGEQLALNRRFAGELGFANAVEDWQQLDICDLSGLAPHSFDVVVAYGGVFSYVLEQRDRAMDEVRRALKPGGVLLLSVMSLWGTVHAFLPGVLQIPAENNRRILKQGDLTAATIPGRQGNFMHLFRSGELQAWLEQTGWQVMALSASNCLATGWQEQLAGTRQDPAAWAELLLAEMEACAEPGCLDMGTHLIAVVSQAQPA